MKATTTIIAAFATAMTSFEIFCIFAAGWITGVVTTLVVAAVREYDNVTYER